MTRKTTASLFTGGGGFEVGAMLAGFTPTWGVEIRPDIAAVAEANIPGLRVIVSDVAAVDYSSLERPDHLHASPSCKNASQASDGEEAPEDLSSAGAICRAIEALLPDSFTLENVWAYRNFESFRRVVATLTRLGYFVDWWHLNSADYGVPQTRKRLILIARRDRQPTRPAPTHSKTPDMFGLYKPWVGWYEAILDLIPTLPDSEFAPWQLARLPAELKTLLLAHGSYEGEVVNRGETDPAFTITANSNQGGVRALLVAGQNATNEKITRPIDEPAYVVTNQGKGLSRAFLLNKSADKYGDGAANGESPAFTIVSNSQGRYKAFVVDGQESTGAGNLIVRSEDQPLYTVTATVNKGMSRAAVAGRVVKMTPRCLARFQSFPDEYVLPGANGLACEIVGNAIPPLLARAICESLKGQPHPLTPCPT